MTPGIILAAGAALAFLLAVMLQHRVEVLRLRGPHSDADRQRGIDEGLELAARIIENHSSALAATVRAARRGAP